jgi:hypothetical protein
MKCKCKGSGFVTRLLLRIVTAVCLMILMAQMAGKF